MSTSQQSYCTDDSQVLSQPQGNTNYVVITPVRDEEAYIRFTIESMLRQTILPQEWMLVNDGSTDSTGAIIDEYASRHSWIRAVHRKNRGYRAAGGGVVDAFNAGYRELRTRNWNFVVKFDGDLTFQPDYFERCLQEFERDPKLGIGGGTICYMIEGVKEIEECPAFHVRGATKIYRRNCWEAIGGLWAGPGFDTVDEVKANRLGWTTRAFPDLHLIHHRRTSTADGIWAGLIKDGRADYVCGYHPLFMLSKCAVRTVRKPYVIGSIVLFYGFLSGYWKGIAQVDDRVTIEYLRREQLNRLLGRQTIWR
jgi:poly-beta-1,6-N-acetyl-D-glucosamine synthase